MGEVLTNELERAPSLKSMSKTHAVTLYVDVNDAAQLHSHAMQIATNEDMQMSIANAEDLLGTAAEPDISACLRMVFDPGQSPPGTSILDSSCE